MMRPFRIFAIRDLILLLITLILWQNLIDSSVFHVMTAAFTGISALLFHEWGHLLGAHLSGAIVHRAPSVFSPFLFDLDSQRNTRPQFLLASGTGFIATSCFLFFFVLVLPLDTLAGRLSLYLALGLASLTVIIEFPIAWLVYQKKKIPRVEIFR